MCLDCNDLVMLPCRYLLSHISDMQYKSHSNLLKKIYSIRYKLIGSFDTNRRITSSSRHIRKSHVWVKKKKKKSKRSSHLSLHAVYFARITHSLSMGSCALTSAPLLVRSQKRKRISQTCHDQINSHRTRLSFFCTLGPQPDKLIITQNIT